MTFFAPMGYNGNQQLKTVNSEKLTHKKIRKCDLFQKVSISTMVQPQGNLEMKFERNALYRL